MISIFHLDYLTMLHLAEEFFDACLYVWDSIFLPTNHSYSSELSRLLVKEYIGDFPALHKRLMREL